MANLDEMLRDLNPAQLQAVQHPPQVPLQILAGPGSGKTKVLTMRIAYLITICSYPPGAICAVTFTNKAANEMRERLVKLIGKDNTAQIKMGTFHALCAMFLRRYSKHVGIEGNFTVCDADESKKIITKLFKPYKEQFADKNLAPQEGTVISIISKLKAKGLSADDAKAKLAKNNAISAEERIRRIIERQKELLEGDLGRIVVEIYKEYEKILRRSNSLDFDDLLLFGVKLFAKHKKASSWCQHVLVDEYQDTNTMQYQLMKYIAQSSRCVTIVGDPDQSIYGWRSAEITNLTNMKLDFPTTQQIYLEHNYRSTAAILALSMAIISQDKKRIDKTLNTSHSKGPLPVLRAFPMDKIEAAFIAAEIKRLVAFTGGMFKYSDFAILIRFTAHSRLLESALQKEGIPCRVLKGHKFFERMEVKEVLAYLQLVDNPTFVPAFTRVINVPSRKVGEKTITELLHRAEQLKVSPLQVVERIVEGKIPDIKPPVKRKLASFIDIIRDLRKFANEGMSPSKLITALTEEIHYEDHLRKTQPDHESRWDNVQELISFAADVENNMPEHAGNMMNDAEDAAHEELWGDDLGEWDLDQVDKKPEAQGSGDTPLRYFLQASMLSTDSETPEDEASKEKVTISTCHAAKGLEWAVVMIPAVEWGVFPSARAEDTEEELRLLYVACTRAQALLYLSHAQTRTVAGEPKPQELSDFIATVRSDSKTRGTFSEELPALPPQDLAILAKVLNRPIPDAAEVTRQVTEYQRTGRHPVWGPNAPFRELPTGPLNGYGMPIRYPRLPEQQPDGGDVVQQWQHRPQAQAAMGGRADGVPEPPLFMPSSILHFNNTHRAAIVQPLPPVASSSRVVEPKPKSSGRPSNGANTIASSSGREFNASSPQPSGSNLRGWIKQSDGHHSTDKLSNGKGKARALPVTPLSTTAKPGLSTAKLSSSASKAASTAPASPSASPHAILIRVRSVKVEPVVKQESGVRKIKQEPRESEQRFREIKQEPVRVKQESMRAIDKSPCVKQEVCPVNLETQNINMKRELEELALPDCPPGAAVSSNAKAAVSMSTAVSRHIQPPESTFTGEPPSSSGPSVPSSSSSASAGNSLPDAPADPGAKPHGVKRRLGMGRATTGYTNKKFKPIVPNAS